MAVTSWLAERWAGFTEPALEWSFSVRAGRCVTRTKWLAWTGPHPRELVPLCREAGLGHLLPLDAEAARIRNLGIGFDGQTPVCLYLEQMTGSGRLMQRIGPGGTVTYTFHSFAEFPDVPEGVVARLLEDPVVRKKSGFWLRSDQPRVYVTFPHHPPVRELRRLLEDELDTTGMVEHDDQHFRHVCVLGGEQPALTVYLSGRSAIFPTSHADLRTRVATWAGTVFRSEPAQELVRQAS